MSAFVFLQRWLVIQHGNAQLAKVLKIFVQGRPSWRRSHYDAILFGAKTDGAVASEAER